MNAKATLYKKILAVQKVLEPLEKNGRNDFHKYNYTTAGDVLLPVQCACNEHGLIVVADCIDSNIEPGRACVTVKLTVADSETGESMSISCPGYAEDWSHKDNKPTGDKAIYKAVTGATKYAVRSFFCLPSEDDPERVDTPQRSPSSTRSTPPKARTAPLATAPQPPAQPPPEVAQLIEQTTQEMKRVGWSNNQGRAYLQQNFGKSSRQALTEQELQQFLTELKAMPNPVPMPIPA